MGMPLVWKADIADWENISVESYRFVFDQAKERLEEVITESHAIVARSMNTLLSYIAVFSAILGFIFSNLAKIDGFILLLISLLVIFSIYIFTLLFALISSRQIIYRGSPPKEIFRIEFFKNEDPEWGYKNLLYNEVERIQDKIEQIDRFNKKRMNQYRSVLKVSLFLVVLVVFALFKKMISGS